jgi:1-acyl-sn-glycerol-3-phosphate acyltransferase
MYQYFEKYYKIKRQEGGVFLKDYFYGDFYETQTNSRKTIDKLFLNTRWYFIKKFIESMVTSRALALKNVYDNKAWGKASYEFLKFTEGSGGLFQLSGLDNIRKIKEPVVYVSNHMSTLETFVFPCILLMGGDISFVVKESLTTNFLFGPVMRATNPIVVKRENPREDLKTVMEKGKELLNNGTSVVIFPQSTRSAVFNPGEFNTLGVKLAKSAGVKVLPIAIKTDFWANGKLIKDLGTIHRELKIYMSFGEPISIQKNGKEEHQQIMEFITTHLKSWR